MHGGVFYHPVKSAVKLPQLPGHLHWFYWESYSTWLSGFALFTVSYLWSAGTYLIDKPKMDWAPWPAITVAILFLVVFWLLHDLICRLLYGQRKNGDAIVDALVLVRVCVASWLACHWFAGRAAFLPVDPIHGKRGKQRSVHTLTSCCRCRDPPVSCHAPRLQAGPQWQPLAPRRGGRGGDFGHGRLAGISEAERMVIKQWFESGAKTD